MVVGGAKTRELHPEGNLWVGSTPSGSQGDIINSTLDPAALVLTENFLGANISFKLTKNG